MRVEILGSAAGGGFPQWNCHCFNCNGVRQGTIAATPRLQSSLAIAGDDGQWILVNASPDIRAQLARTPALCPYRGQTRSTAIAAIILADAQLDHTAGLLFLRESGDLTVYSTTAVATDLRESFPVLTMLANYGHLTHHTIPLTDPGTAFTISSASRLRFRAIPLAGKAPPYADLSRTRLPGDNIALLVTDETTGRRLLYAPGIAAYSPELLAAIHTADCLLVDGTFWTAEETCPLNGKSAQAMGHLPLAGEGGSLATLRSLTHTRRVLTHINNTNPILRDDSRERAELTALGIEVAYDGMVLEV